ncbi:DUF3846 domain-containing protein [Schumannella sp. 10F1B-5-1]|uniref:DUF3846 domain-containing protein n=1 Tax=Schumannella sp. 10F1B-5-1 TaxID=2590780 RepID=UPI001130187A|nr:DUF3846 domain-containing protein [Schumannella sp. 10F1B-5-1]TPW78395.1 DUF3846 domain-containing protein [Schumannella sp. 10F1B-5-1]
MLRGLKVGIDGVLSSVEIDDTTADARMEGMHRAIGCHTYDVVGYTDTVDVWVDDEGLYRSSVNAELSVMLRRERFAGQGAWFGTGLFLGIDHTSGESRSLTPGERAGIVQDWSRKREPAEYRFMFEFLFPTRARR